MAVVARGSFAVYYCGMEVLIMERKNSIMESWNRFVESYIEIRDEIDEKIANTMDDLIDKLAKNIRRVVWKD